MGESAPAAVNSTVAALRRKLWLPEGRKVGNSSFRPDAPQPPSVSAGSHAKTRVGIPSIPNDGLDYARSTEKPPPSMPGWFAMAGQSILNRMRGDGSRRTKLRDETSGA